MCSPGGGGLRERSSGTASVYGDLLLSCMVGDGEKAVPGLLELHLDGIDTDDADSATH